MVDASNHLIVQPTAVFYTVKEVAQRWKTSSASVRRIFGCEEGVLKIGSERSRKVGRRYVRRHVMLRIPEFVLLRKEDALMHKRRPESVPARDPVRGLLSVHVLGDAG